MSALNLTFDELVTVVRSCEAIQIQRCTPPYLRDFIARRLQQSAPALVPKVSGFDDGQMTDLCEYIRETHRLIVRHLRPDQSGGGGLPTDPSDSERN